MATRVNDLKPVYPFQYQQLAERIRERIKSGELPPGGRLESVREIAKKEGVSGYTVARAIEQLQTMGYLDTKDRKGVFVRRSEENRLSVSRVGVLVPHLPGRIVGPDSVTRSMQHIISRLKQLGCQISLHDCLWHPHPELTLKYIPVEEFRRRDLEALVIVGIYDLHYFSALAELGLPMAAFDLDASGLGIDSVFVDNVEGALNLTKALLDRGHRRVVYVGGPRAVPKTETPNRQFDPSAVERADGYRLAMRLFARDEEVHCFHAEGGRTTESGRACAARALKAVPDCTALVSEGPVDLKSLGAEHLEMAHFCRKGSTSTATITAQCDFTAMAETAAKLLLERIKYPERPAERRMFGTEIRIGESAQMSS